MKKILSIDALAAEMGISKSRLCVLAEPHLIRPDMVDDKDRPYWLPETAERLVRVREAQKHLPRSVRRQYS